MKWRVGSSVVWIIVFTVIGAIVGYAIAPVFIHPTSPIPPTPTFVTTIPSVGITNTQIVAQNIETVTVYGSRDDGEVLYLSCTQSWDACRNAATSNARWESLKVSTVGSGRYSGEYLIQRAFLFFDTSSIPANAIIHMVTLYLYSGEFQNGNKTIHVVRSDANTPLSTSDYSRVEFVSGGSAVSSRPFSWMSINLQSFAFDWIAKGGTTGIALIHDNDLNQIAPEGANDIMIATAEDELHRPYMIITYSIP